VSNDTRRLEECSICGARRLLLSDPVDPRGYQGVALYMNSRSEINPDGRSVPCSVLRRGTHHRYRLLRKVRFEDIAKAILTACDG